jgi:hypothetical protein
VPLSSRFQAALEEHDGESRRLIVEFEKVRKQVQREAAGGAADAEQRVRLPGQRAGAGRPCFQGAR